MPFIWEHMWVYEHISIYLLISLFHSLSFLTVLVSTSPTDANHLTIPVWMLVLHQLTLAPVHIYGISWICRMCSYVLFDIFVSYFPIKLLSRDNLTGSTVKEWIISIFLLLQLLVIHYLLSVSHYYRKTLLLFNLHMHLVLCHCSQPQKLVYFTHSIHPQPWIERRCFRSLPWNQ